MMFAAERLNRLLGMTAWRMVKPAAYGPFHLGFFLGGLAVSVLLARALRGVGERGFRAVMRFCGFFLLGTELYKQLFYTFRLGGGQYPWWIFPFQLCSIPMYLCLLCGFLKPCRARDAMCDFMLAFNLMGGFLAFLEPSGLVHEYWTLTLHAFLWHMMLIFIGLWLGFSGRAARRPEDFRRTVLVFLCLNAIAFGLNLALFPASNGEINMFFVGPRISSIAVFHDIAARYGWYVNTPLYILCQILAAAAFYFPFARANRTRAAPAEGART